MKHVRLPFLKWDNIYVVPVLSERLSGAVMVRRTIQNLKLTDRDLVAVARPTGVTKEYRDAVNDLPKTTLLYIAAQDDKRAQRVPKSPPQQQIKELVAVTPCDGMSEAVLSAKELEVAAQLIDLDVSPSSQEQRPPCGIEALGMDDWLGVTAGAESFVDLFHDYPVIQSRRTLPIDELRERHMARQLQRLSHQYDRVLFVCYVENIPGIEAAIRHSLTTLDAPKFVGDISRQRGDIKADFLLQHLDDYPKVVEHYWHKRNSSEALKEFDKMSLVFDEIIDCSARAGSEWSMRHHQAFKQMLSGVMGETGRCSIPLVECLSLMNSCYDRAFVDNVRIRLLTFDEGGAFEKEARHTFPSETLSNDHTPR